MTAEEKTAAIKDALERQSEEQKQDIANSLYPVLVALRKYVAQRRQQIAS